MASRPRRRPPASRPRLLDRPVLAVAAALTAALAAAGCVSMPSAGPVEPYPVTQGSNAQAQPYVQIIPSQPGRGWSPTQIVQGFLTAAASFGDNGDVAREYLTQQASKDWNPSWSAVVYKNGPNVSAPVYSSPSPSPKPTSKSTAKASPTAKAKAQPPETAMVSITGTVQANLSGNGSYAVASASEPSTLPYFVLTKAGGQWRISKAWQQLLLTSDSFANDYQLRNLYFFDPQTRYLVPDPVYVPLQATPAQLMDGLVTDLVKQPDDWLAGGATRTAFPPGTSRLGDVTLAGVTAVVNLGGAIVHASSAVMEQVSAQLLSTLSGAGQGGQAVQSVEVLQNGKPWIPNGSQDNPVQSKSSYSPPSGASDTFYYLGPAGVVYSKTGAHGSPVEVAKLTGEFDQIAVSADGKYLAALTATGNLYTGPLGGPLAKRSGTGYSSASWDPSDDLWATTATQIVVLRGSRMVPVNGIAGVTALEVAPDGVRVALIVGNEILDFGALSWEVGTRQGQESARIVLSPFSVQSAASFEAVTWYGPDDVITLANPGPTPSVTEYPVNGGNSTPIPGTPDMQSISASPGDALIAGLSGGHMAADASLTGSWTPIGPGSTPTYPG